MNLRPRIGLRGKLSLILGASILLFAALLTIASSGYLSRNIDSEQTREASDLAGLIQASAGPAGVQQSASRVQSTIESLLAGSPDLKELTVYAPVAGKGDLAIASTDKSLIGSMVALGASGQSVFSELHSASGGAIGSLGVQFDGARRQGLIRSEEINIIMFSGLMLLLVLSIVNIFFSRMVVHPVKDLIKATRRAGSPDWRPAIVSRHQNEITDLGNAFNSVASSLNSRDEEVGLLLDTSFAISSALHVDRILQVLCEKIGTSQNLSYCRIALLGSCQNALVVKAVWPKQHGGSQKTGQIISLAEAPYHAQVLLSREPLAISRNPHDPDKADADAEWAHTPQIQSGLLLPLVSKKEVLGVLALGDKRNLSSAPFSSRKIGFYKSLVSQAAVAIENAMLYEKTEWQICELSAMHNMSQSFTSTLDYQEVVNVVAQRVGNLIGAQSASVLLPAAHSGLLRIVASHNLSEDYVRKVNNQQQISLGSGPIGKAFALRKPIFVDNVFSDPGYIPWTEIASEQGYSSLIALPLIAKDQSIGVICLYFKEPCQLAHDEIDLLVTAANEAAISIENARIYESLEGAFMGTIQSLTETMGAKDSYTLGHLERVSHYAETIARNIGITGDELQAIRYAGYLHDVGKIGIPDSILVKPGKLEHEEFNIIRDHPILSERILKPVNFPFPVHSIVRHHHERYDGLGYPDNLAGQEIPLGARILFVADSYEAMTSNRPYRKALSSDEAILELKRHKGTQFDPRIVDIFLSIMTEQQDAEPLELTA